MQIINWRSLSMENILSWGLIMWAFRISMHVLPRKTSLLLTQELQQHHQHPRAKINIHSKLDRLQHRQVDRLASISIAVNLCLIKGEVHEMPVLERMWHPAGRALQLPKTKSSKVTKVQIIQATLPSQRQSKITLLTSIAMGSRPHNSKRVGQCIRQALQADPPSTSKKLAYASTASNASSNQVAKIARRMIATVAISILLPSKRRL